MAAGPGARAFDYDRAAIVLALRKVAAWFEAGVEIEDDAAITERGVPVTDDTREDSALAANS